MITSPVSARLQRALFLPLTILAWLAVVVVAGWLLSHITRAVLILVLGALIAFALTPLVNWLDRWMPRGLAIALAYLVGFTFVFGLLGLLVVSAASEISSFVGHLPAYVRAAHDLEPQVLALLRPLGVTPDQLVQAESEVVKQLQTVGTETARGALNAVQAVFGALVDAVLVLILSVYLTASGPRLLAWLRDQAPAGQRRRAVLLLGIVDQVVGGYVRGTLTLAAGVGLAVGGGMALLHVRYALLLGILAFFMEFVPVLGVLVSGAVCVLVALFNGWITALLVVAYFAVVHVLEGDVVGPRIMAKAVGVHPAVAILALVAGSELFGIWGALFGAPIAGLLQAIAVAAYREVRLVRAREARELAEQAEEEVLTQGPSQPSAGTQKAGAAPRVRRAAPRRSS